MISAVATAHGKGGVAVIRISGEGALALAEKMFAPTGKTPVADFEPYKMYAGNIQGEGLTDFGLCVYFVTKQSVSCV
jgi:tRNA modification GTPase